MIISFNKKYLLYTYISNIFINYKYIYIFHNNKNIQLLKKYCFNNNIKSKILVKGFIHFNKLYSNFFKILFISSNYIIYSNNINNIIKLYNKCNLLDNKYICLGLIYKNIYFNVYNLPILIKKISIINNLKLFKYNIFLKIIKVDLLYLISFIFLVIKKIVFSKLIW